MSRRSRRRRDVVTNRRLHSDSRTQSRRTYFDPWAPAPGRSYSGVTKGARRQAKPRRARRSVVVDLNVNVGRSIRPFGEYVKGLQRLHSQRAAIVGVESLKRNPVVKECVRRHERREVLLSQGVGGRKVRPPVFTKKSKVRC